MLCLLPGLVMGADAQEANDSGLVITPPNQDTTGMEPKVERDRPQKVAAGLLIGVLTGLGAGVVDYGLSRVVYQAVDPDPEGNFARGVIVSPYVAFALGAGVGSSFGVNRYGQSIGHQGRLGPTLVGGALGSIALGGGLALTSRFVSGIRVQDGEPYDSFGAAAYGMAIGGVLGGGIGSFLAYEASDPLNGAESVSLRMHLMPVATGDVSSPLAMGLGLSGSF